MPQNRFDFELFRRSARAQDVVAFWCRRDAARLADRKVSRHIGGW